MSDNHQHTSTMADQMSDQDFNNPVGELDVRALTADEQHALTADAPGVDAASITIDIDSADTQDQAEEVHTVDAVDAQDEADNPNGVQQDFNEEEVESEPSDTRSEQDDTSAHDYSRTCSLCYDDDPTTDIRDMDCGHTLCIACIEKIFEDATISEMKYPPTCCGVQLYFEDYEDILSSDLHSRLSAVEEERSIPIRDRRYCALNACSNLLPPFPV